MFLQNIHGFSVVLQKMTKYITEKRLNLSITKHTVLEHLHSDNHKILIAARYKIKDDMYATDRLGEHKKMKRLEEF